MDALIVKRLFSPEVAGNYAPIVTLGKMNLFVPLAMGLVLFPKATQRVADGRDPRPILLLALAATLLPGLALTAVFYLFADLIVPLLFTDAYASLGLILPLVGLATTLYAGLNIWLNYALSLKRQAFVYGLGVVVVLQIMGMSVSTSLINFALVMVTAGLLGNIVGFLTTWRIVEA
jgi:O-antigen/teichoic acid export membrane protein